MPLKDAHRCTPAPPVGDKPGEGFLSPTTTAGVNAINPSRQGTCFALMRYVLSLTGTPQHHINGTREKWTGDVINLYLECHYLGGPAIVQLL